MKTILKSAVVLIALVLTNTISFAAAKAPEVYASESNLSDLSVNELLNTAWFWILVVASIVVFLAALIATKDQETATHYPDHII
ncbi:MAG TPA: hypothetical protein VF273_00385 [Pelobium sp.]